MVDMVVPRSQLKATLASVLRYLLNLPVVAVADATPAA
jgi:acetyl-CoA carboxylase beta subunit